jgi:hypothetical protein
MSPERLGEVEARLDAMERDLAAILSALAGARPSAPSPGPAGLTVEADESNRPTRDEVWACSRCAARLALYDPEADLLRVRYKDFTAHFRTGAGGLVRIVCRACSEINEIQHVDERAPAPPPPPALAPGRSRRG